CCPREVGVVAVDSHPRRGRNCRAHFFSPTIRRCPVLTLPAVITHTLSSNQRADKGKRLMNITTETLVRNSKPDDGGLRVRQSGTRWCSCLLQCFGVPGSSADQPWPHAGHQNTSVRGRLFSITATG